MTDQPMPKRSKASKPVCVAAQQRFNALLVSQRMVGEMDYGVPLATFNGRSAYLDLMTEMADAVHYATQAEMEREEIVKRAQGMAKALEKVIDVHLRDGTGGHEAVSIANAALSAWDELGLVEAAMEEESDAT